MESKMTLQDIQITAEKVAKKIRDLQISAAPGPEKSS
jgi:hypothetical protein